MDLAANMEESTQKHPVTPGEVIPARELQGEMLLQMNKPAEALAAFEADLKEHTNRFNGLYGAGLAAERSSNMEKAKLYYGELSGIADIHSSRPELDAARLFLKKH